MKDRHPLIKASMILAILAILSALAFWGAKVLVASWTSYRSPLASAPPAPGAPLPAAISRRLVWILADGLDLETAANAALMPAIASLRSAAASGSVRAQGPTNPLAAWAVLLTGAEPAVADAPLLEIGTAAPRPLSQDGILASAARAGRRPALAASELLCSMAADGKIRLAAVEEEDHVADRELAAAALSWLSAGTADVIVLRLGQLSWAGRFEGGPRSAAWDAAARRVDGIISQVSSRLDPRRDTLVVSSSYGISEGGGSGGPEAACAVTPLLIHGAGAIPGVHGRIRQVDLAPTLAVLVGAALPASAAGSPAMDMIHADPETALALIPAEKAQKAALAEALAAALPKGERRPNWLLFGMAVLGWLLPGVWSLIKARGRDARMAHGRSARFTRNRILLFLGALGAAVASHGIYALVLGKGYSVSWFPDMESLIRSAFPPAIYAFSAVALVVILGTPSLRTRPFEAFRATIELAFWTAWDLLLPFAAFLALHGIEPALPLPNATAWFFSLLCALMALGAVGGGLLASLLAMAGTALAGFEGRRERGMRAPPPVGQPRSEGDPPESDQKKEDHEAHSH